MEEVKKLVSDISKGILKPIYFLMGDEPYFIDKISEYIQNNVLTETEKEFNQMVLYGRDTSIAEIIEHAKRFPLMAERQVLIIKEAQDLSRTIASLESYAKNPQNTTVLVFNYKFKKLDKRTTLYKALQKNSIVLESKKLYDNQIPYWINNVLNGQGYKITPKASLLLVEFLGTSLGTISNELEKLKIVLPKGTEITAQHIEENIGISKDYNNFELRKAIGNKDVKKAFKIIQYFSENPNKNPIIVTVSLLFSFFSQLLVIHSMSDKNPKSIAAKIKVNPYFVSEYLVATKNYPMKKVSKIITVLREIDVKSKGVGASRLQQGDLLKEMLAKILV